MYRDDFLTWRKQYLINALKDHCGQITPLARTLKIDRTRVYGWLKEHGLSGRVNEFRTGDYSARWSDRSYRDDFLAWRKGYLVSVIKKLGGNVTAISKFLGVDRTHVYYMLRQHNLMPCAIDARYEKSLSEVKNG